jgi:hypothetical protein
MLVARRVSQVENQGLHTNEGVLNSVGTHVKRQSIYRPIVNFLYRYLSIVHLPDSLCIWGIVYGIVFLSVPFLTSWHTLFRGARVRGAPRGCRLGVATARAAQYG